MCRHFAYLGPVCPLAELVLDPPHSLYRQSWAPRTQAHGTVNADGFGLGWYPPGDEDAPARFRRVGPIWADPDLPDLARTLRSGAVLAAVRSATPGTSQDASAAAPFRAGRWLFSHNGAVDAWEQLPEDLAAAAAAEPGAPAPAAPLPASALLALEARSDSALLWALVQARLAAGEPPGDALAAVTLLVAAVRPGARLNLLLTDGRSIAAVRWGDTLSYRADGTRVLVASEPFEPAERDDPGSWTAVPEHTLLLADRSGVGITPLPPGPDPPPRLLPSPSLSPSLRTGLSPAPSLQATERSRPMTPDFTLDRRLPEHHFTDALRTDASEGLTAHPKALPPVWFYDATGSDLFEQITELPEYYPTRAEHEILAARAPEIAAAVHARTLVELGSGSSQKTRLLLDALRDEGSLRGYVPVDVSESALRQAAEAVTLSYPGLEVHALVADFHQHLGLDGTRGPRLLAFLGGTIGNLLPEQRAAFLTRIRAALEPGDALLLGTDLVKDPATLVAAYDDSAGITAAFNKNLLTVLNHGLDADFDPDEFRHVALWDPEHEWIEMRLRATRPVQVKLRELDLVVPFEGGEDLRTEISAKFRQERVRSELQRSGLTLRHWWTDEAGRYALSLSSPAPHA